MAYLSQHTAAYVQDAAGGGAQTVAIAAAVETSTAQNLGIRKGIGAPVETSTAQPVTRRTTRTLTAAPETSTAQAVTRRKTRAIAAPVETSTAPPSSPCSGCSDPSSPPSWSARCSPTSAIRR